MSMRPRSLATAVLLCTGATPGAAFGDDIAVGSRVAERQGVLVGGDVALGVSSKSLLGQIDGRLGWMVTPRLGAFGAALIGRGVGLDRGRYHVEAVGVRAWLSDVWFLDGRIGWAHTQVKDDDDGVTVRASRLGYLVGVGVEGELAHFGLDVHLVALRTGDIHGILLGVGVSYY